MHTATATSTHTQASTIEVLDTRASTCRTVKAVSPSQYRSECPRARSPHAATPRRATSDVAKHAAKPMGMMSAMKYTGWNTHEPHTTASRTAASTAWPPRATRPPRCMRSGARSADMSSISGRRAISRAPSTAFTANTTAKHPAVHAAESGEKENASRQGASNTKAATAPNAGDSAAPAAKPHASAPAPTSAVSATSTTDTAPRPMPHSS